MPTDVSDAPPSADESPIEEAARAQLGLRWWDRPTLFRETAEAATDTDLPFWSVLLLSGAIATFGLTLNSTAVVIGAMLVAPLLGPLLGLSMALAVGDGRLALQTALTILLGAVGVVALAAVMTSLLPFQVITDEIAARTRPTALDLVIAVASGLAGAVVTASREKRLSASIPGVAIAVALIPPLGVAGFGIGAGLQWALVRGSLLLFGANLAGIVLSGLLVFLLVGMHRPDVVAAAQRWHAEGHATGLAKRLAGLHAFDRVRVFASPWARVGLVAAFVAAVAVPLTTSLKQVVRETRLSAAVDRAESVLTRDGSAFVIDRDLTVGVGAASARLRVATTAWIPETTEDSLEALATDAAGEPVTLELEQVLASAGDLNAFAQALPARPAVRTEPAAPDPPDVPTALATVRGRLATVLDGLALPDSVRIAGGTVTVGPDGPALRIGYAAARRLPREAEAVVARQAAQALGLEPDRATVEAILTSARAVPDSASAPALGGLLERYPRLRLVVSGDTAAVRSAGQALRTAAAPADRIRLQPRPGPARARLVLATDG